MDAHLYLPFTHEINFTLSMGTLVYGKIPNLGTHKFFLTFLTFFFMYFCLVQSTLTDRNYFKFA